MPFGRCGIVSTIVLEFCPGLRDDAHMAESQLDELRNMRVLLEEAWMLTRNLAYHRRARLETVLRRALEEVDQQIQELRGEGRN